MDLPALLFAKVEHRGAVASLACVATHWSDEGTCLVELLQPDGRAVKAIANGVWHSRRVQLDGSALNLEVDDPGIEGWPELLDKLMAEAVRHGGWGFDTYVPQGGS